MPENQDVIKKYKAGLACIRLNQKLDVANRIFLDLIKNDSTFCDAYYLAGCTFQLSHKDQDAFNYYYMADSLSNNKSMLFKQDLAYMAGKMGNFQFARKKYEEMKHFFPKSPEGYYGIASSSLAIGDSEYGLENIKLAMLAYNQYGLEQALDVYLIQGILLTLNEKYDESIVSFEKLVWPITASDTFRAHYALSLLKEGKLNNDEKQIKKAKKLYGKVKNKTALSEKITSEFQ